MHKIFANNNTSKLNVNWVGLTYQVDNILNPNLAANLTAQHIAGFKVKNMHTILQIHETSKVQNIHIFYFGKKVQNIL